jgi:hypothetical protein
MKQLGGKKVDIYGLKKGIKIPFFPSSMQITGKIKNWCARCLGFWF